MKSSAICIRRYRPSTYLDWDASCCCCSPKQGHVVSATDRECAATTPTTFVERWQKKPTFKPLEWPYTSSDSSFVMYVVKPRSAQNERASNKCKAVQCIIFKRGLLCQGEMSFSHDAFTIRIQLQHPVQCSNISIQNSISSSRHRARRCS